MGNFLFSQGPGDFLGGTFPDDGILEKTVPENQISVTVVAAFAQKKSQYSGILWQVFICELNGCIFRSFAFNVLIAGDIAADIAQGIDSMIQLPDVGYIQANQNKDGHNDQVMLNYFFNQKTNRQ